VYINLNQLLLTQIDVIHNGNMYYKLGFNLDHVSKPNYEWISDDHTIRLNRLNCFKSKVKQMLNDYNDNLSVKANMINHKFYQLFDCR
jgi:hypothetical protein